MDSKGDIGGGCGGCGGGEGGAGETGMAMRRSWETGGW